MQKYCSEDCQAEAKRLRKKRQQDLINGIEPIMDMQHQEYLTFSKAAILMGCTRQYIYKLDSCQQEQALSKGKSRKTNTKPGINKRERGE